MDCRKAAWQKLARVYAPQSHFPSGEQIAGAIGYKQSPGTAETIGLVILCRGRVLVALNMGRIEVRGG